MSHCLTTCVALLALSVSYSVVAAQDKPRASQPAVQTQTVQLVRGDSKFACYLARPAGDAPAPGILIIHEWWGLNDWIKQQAERFAQQGYVALAVDLYHGEIAKDAEHAHELMRGLSDERAVADLKFAFEFLAGHKYARGKPVGVIGWCMGGGYALKLAIAEPRVACTVVCYGKPVTEPAQLRKIKGPLLGIWGATDRGIDVDEFKKALKEAGAKDTHKVYSKSGHAFMNPNNQRGYNAEQAEKAWKEIDAFLKRELQK